MSIRCEYIW